MKQVKWEEVDEVTTVDWLPQGGYVIKIVDVEDNPDWECLNIVFDVVGGEYNGKFAKTPADRAWTHTLRQSYSDNAKRFFKGFLTALERSNPGFTVADWQRKSDERELIGLYVGAIINYYHYINEKGTLVKRYNFARACDVYEIKSGNFTVPDDRWSAEAEAEQNLANTSTVQTGVQNQIYTDCPF